MIMKTRYFKLVTVCLLAVSLFASCLGDLDTLPLDDNELTGEMVYSTPEGYIGMIAKCYAALIQTGQKGGDGGDGMCRASMKDILVILVPCSTCRKLVRMKSYSSPVAARVYVPCFT